MKTKIFYLIILLIPAGIISAQQKNNWDKLDYLIGKWVGEGSGQPGKGGGYFTFGYDLDKKIITRKSHSEYPATDNKPKIVHEDLMNIYLDNSGEPSRAIYFDNEGHVLHYSITYPDSKNIVFTSDKIGNAPVFRLTYTKIDENTVNVKFEMSNVDNSFTTYVIGKSYRSK